MGDWNKFIVKLIFKFEISTFVVYVKCGLCGEILYHMVQDLLPGKIGMMRFAAIWIYKI
jgi:hypothetical protein